MLPRHTLKWNTHTHEINKSGKEVTIKSMNFRHGGGFQFNPAQTFSLQKRVQGSHIRLSSSIDDIEEEPMDYMNPCPRFDWQHHRNFVLTQGPPSREHRTARAEVFWGCHEAPPAAFLGRWSTGRFNLGTIPVCKNETWTNKKTLGLGK